MTAILGSEFHKAEPDTVEKDRYRCLLNDHRFLKFPGYSVMFAPLSCCPHCGKEFVKTANGIVDVHTTGIFDFLNGE